MRDQNDRIGHHGIVALVRAIPFKHGEFGQMQPATLAVTKNPRKFEYPLLTGGEQLLASELRRRPQVTRPAPAVGADQFRAWRMQVDLVARRYLQDSGFDLDKALFVEPGPDRPCDGISGHKKRPDVPVTARRPPRRSLIVGSH